MYIHTVKECVVTVNVNVAMSGIMPECFHHDLPPQVPCVPLTEFHRMAEGILSDCVLHAQNAAIFVP